MENWERNPKNIEHLAQISIWAFIGEEFNFPYQEIGQQLARTWPSPSWNLKTFNEKAVCNLSRLSPIVGRLSSNRWRSSEIGHELGRLLLVIPIKLAIGHRNRSRLRPIGGWLCRQSVMAFWNRSKLWLIVVSGCSYACNQSTALSHCLADSSFFCLHLLRFSSI